MSINLKGKSFLSLKDFTKEEINYLLDLSKNLKSFKKSGIINKPLNGKNIVLIFEKTSTRTRCSFEVAANDLGLGVTFLNINDTQISKKESIEDTAKVLGRFYDGIEYRGFKEETVEMLAKYSGVPVWNGLTDIDHPTQVLADFLTIKEHLNKPFKEIKFVYVGDGRNNMCNALMIGATKVEMDFNVWSPKELYTNSNLVKEMKKNGGKITITDDINIVKDADIIYTDVWVSMGEEDKYEERIKLLKNYQVNMNLIKKTKNPNVLFMHCLPAYHDLNTKVAQDIYNKYGLKELEVTDEVFRSKYSIVFDEAENRLHTIKAIILATLG